MAGHSVGYESHLVGHIISQTDSVAPSSRYFASGTGGAGLVGAFLWWELRGLGVRLGVGLSSVSFVPTPSRDMFRARIPTLARLDPSLCHPHHLLLHPPATRQVLPSRARRRRCGKRASICVLHSPPERRVRGGVSAGDGRRGDRDGAHRALDARQVEARKADADQVYAASL